MKFIGVLAICAAFLASCTFSAPSFSSIKQLNTLYSTEKQAELEPLDWWQRTVVYQVYPRSFQDSDGDGTGDIQGIISRVNYFVELGVEAIWISPIYESPMVDFGYDISNFTNIDPLFGTLDDFKELSGVLRENNIKLIMDFVPNHSSDLHPWFNASVHREGKYADYYVWKDPKGFDEQGKPIVPNNWTSVFAGSMWEWNEQRQQFYLHQFVKEQPDLNYENRQVWNEILAATKFWLDMGVDGFRVDAVPHIFENQTFLDEPFNPWGNPDAKEDEYGSYDHIYTNNLPQVLDFLAEMRMLLDVYTASDGVVRCMMVEAAVDTVPLMGYYGTEQRPIAHFPFNFNLLGMTPESVADDLKWLVDRWFEYMPEGNWASVLIGNHDNRRASTKWSVGAIDAANMVNILFKGTSVTYQGEELGMEDRWISWEDTVDPAGCNVGPDRYEQFSRDPARTPFHWDDSRNAGFSTANKTWLPLHENYLVKNVMAENAAEESHLKVYKSLIELRATNVWKYGSQTTFVLNGTSVFGMIRAAPQSVDVVSFYVLVNVGEASTVADLSGIEGIPEASIVYTRSVGFENGDTMIGSEVRTNAVPLGPRNSLVLMYLSS
ncbi:Maltase 1 [Orchesella cincta]|uniref:alpha-glucosidase n=1 Tax=Orchesella cincta TaxID=48709 RepID=A0A1D2MEZ4_ORCCI|nr:Maltase 1 [Orchesella cincta]